MSKMFGNTRKYTKKEFFLAIGLPMTLFAVSRELKRYEMNKDGLNQYEKKLLEDRREERIAMRLAKTKGEAFTPIVADVSSPVTPAETKQN